MKIKILQNNAAYEKKVADLLEAFGRYTDEQLNKKPADGGWSAIQTAVHLMLSEEGSLAYIRKKLSFNPSLPKNGWGASFRTAMIWFYLNLPIKYKAPSNVADEHIPDFTSLADARARWEKIRNEWKAFFDGMPDHLVDKAIYKHPYGGRLGLSQMLDFFHFHFNRHKGQIERALRG